MAQVPALERDVAQLNDAIQKDYTREMREVLSDIRQAIKLALIKHSHVIHAFKVFTGAQVIIHFILVGHYFFQAVFFFLQNSLFLFGISAVTHNTGSLVCLIAKNLLVKLRPRIGNIRFQRILLSF